MNETLKILKERRSIRSFRPEPVREEDLNASLEAGIYAPSAKNLQSTKLVVVQDRETLALLERVNAELFGDADGHPFYGAPMAVVVLPVAMAAMRSDIEAPFRGCRYGARESMVIPCGIES